jgi:cobalt-precorrin-7 (C5)-methyltransferase
MLYIVGLGPGGKEYIIDIANKTMKKSDVIIGFDRAIKTVSHVKTPKITFKKLNQIIIYIKNNQDKNISLIASGDPTFYGITDYIKKYYDGEIKVIPGISSFQYFMSSIGKTWNNTYLGSLHGIKNEFKEIEDEFIENINKHSSAIFLTDDKISPGIICKSLYENKINAEVYIGENLSYNNEKISHGRPEEFMNLQFSDLSIIYIEIV